MNNHNIESKVSVSASDIKGYVLYAAIAVAIGAGMFAVSPKGMGQVLGVGLAIMLVPLPVFVAYCTRRRKKTKA